MLSEIKKTDLFWDYYLKWITVYKQGAIRDVTLAKYFMTQKWLKKLMKMKLMKKMNTLNK